MRQLPVSVRTWTHVPGVPDAVHRQPWMMYLLPAAPSSDGAEFMTKSP